MDKLILNLCAILKGAVIAIKYKLFSKKCVKFGKTARVFRGAQIEVSSKGTLIIGNKIKVSRRTVVAAVLEGQITIGDNVALGRNNMIICREKISIGSGTILAPNVMVYDHDHIFDAVNGVSRREYKTAPITIGNNCWIGANSIILRGCTIVDNCVIGAGSVVKCNLESGSILVQKRENIIKNISGREL